MNNKPYTALTVIASALRRSCALMALAAAPLFCGASALPTEAPEVQAPAPQDNGKSLKVFFIDHEPSLPTADIIKYLRQERRKATENEDICRIFYMPNGNSPYVATVNLGRADDERNTEDAFDNICAALNEPSHNKNATYDRSSIINLFREFDVIANDYTVNYSSVDMEFILTSEFWTLGYNESIVGALYFALNVPRIVANTNNTFYFNVYVDPDVFDSIEAISNKQPFGIKNYDGINTKIEPTYYDFN